MVMRYADPFDTLFAFQQALENRQLSDWLGHGWTGKLPSNQRFSARGQPCSHHRATRGEQGRY